MTKARYQGKPLSISRRLLLEAGGAAATVTGALSASPAHGQTFGPLTVEITLDGETFTARQIDGEDLGDFVSEIGGFTQRCIKVDVQGIPLKVYFRPDRDDTRQEVVFELGNFLNLNPENLGAYSVTIRDNGSTLATLEIPVHYWFSRWRWQSSQRPIVTATGDLIDAGLLPPYDVNAYQSSSATSPPPVSPPPPPPVSPPPSPPPPVSPPPPPPVSPPPVSPPPPPPPIVVSPPPPPPVVVSPPPPIVSPPPATGGDNAVVDSARIISLLTKGLSGGSLSSSDVNLILQRYNVPIAIPALLARVASAKRAADPSPNTRAPAVREQKNESLGISPDISEYQIMGLAGLYPYMPGTGERPEIGPVTDPQAEYICTGSVSALNKLMAQAEASATMPWHIRDETTSSPFDFRTYPTATWYYDSRTGSPWIKATAPDTPVTLDSAHQPALAYLPYLLTGDPFFLEALQFQATWNHGELPPTYRPSISQPRQYAWSVRTMAQCARITPDVTPVWLMPRSYWADMLEVYRHHLEDVYIDALSPERSVFRVTSSIPDTEFRPWQNEFLVAITGWLLDMGFVEWRRSFEWFAGSTLSRTDRDGDWNRAYSTPYILHIRADTHSPWVESWAEAWELNREKQGFVDADPDTWAVSSDLTYLSYTRGALTYIARLTDVDVSERISWATGIMSTLNSPPYKWRFSA